MLSDELTRDTLKKLHGLSPYDKLDQPIDTFKLKITLCQYTDEKMRRSIETELGVEHLNSGEVLKEYMNKLLR